MVETMYKRLTLLSVTIGLALGLLAFLGYWALGKWQQGLAGQRVGEFAEVAEQIRLDVKDKLDQFIQKEQGRPYTDYLYYHVPGDQAALQQQALTLVRSPLSGRLDHGLAYGHFQVQADGSIMTPNHDLLQRQGANEYNLAIDNEVKRFAAQVRTQLLPLMRTPSSARRLPEVAQSGPQVLEDMPQDQAKTGVKGKTSGQIKALPIESLQNFDQQSQVTRINRQMARDNVVSNRAQVPQAYDFNTPTQQTDALAGQARRSTPQPTQQAEVMDEATVMVRIEPLVPVVVRDGPDPCSVFDGQVYMVRHVQVGEEHLLQGFRLDPSTLRTEVEESARRLVRDNMGFDLSKAESDRAAYTALLDFGFGDLVLNLMEVDPGWIRHKVRWLNGWYFGTIAVVVLAVGLGLVSLWHGAWQQVRLSRQKDDFISAVSHELRTPLTSIRMYAEMLEKGWVRSEEKQGRYYGSIRQESERLSRLIENVLDFSRIQRGRKRYHFSLGDLNAAVSQVVEMMRPFASQHGFVIRTDLASLPPTTFDKDAVTQIVVNLLDNAVKFAHSGADKTLVVRTRAEDGHALIEVEDHGPGVPHAERRRIFEEFYRVEAESTRQTTGTGLGLALVQRFALAHQGFVRVTEAKPQGAIFTVGLGVQMG